LPDFSLKRVIRTYITNLLYQPSYDNDSVRGCLSHGKLNSPARRQAGITKSQFPNKFCITATSPANNENTGVIPAQAGTQNNSEVWIPAFAGMTFLGVVLTLVIGILVII